MDKPWPVAFVSSILVVALVQVGASSGTSFTTLSSPSTDKFVYHKSLWERLVLMNKYPVITASIAKVQNREENIMPSLRIALRQSGEVSLVST